LTVVLLFKHAHELKTSTLRQVSLEVILNEFDNLKKEDLNALDPNLLLEIYQEKTSYPLHLAIENGRDDVIFLYLLSDSNRKINVRNDQGKTPLKVALDSHHYRIASTLIETGCDVDSPDTDSRTILYHIVSQGDLESVKFLLNNKANVNFPDKVRILEIKITIFGK